MKSAFLFIPVTLFLSLPLTAQETKYPEQEPMKPAMTEYWQPQPPVVKPGKSPEKAIAAPSDALILFDGKDLSQWSNSKGEPAAWIVSDGVFTVKKEQATSRPEVYSTIFNCILSGAFPKELQERARQEEIAVFFCKVCTRYRFSIVTKMKLT